MESALLDLSGSEKPALVQENMIAYMRLFAGLPGVAQYDAEAYWFVSGRPAPGDIVLRARWPEESAEERIDAMLAQIGQHCARIDWMVFPGDRPADLNRRLETRGMPGGRGGNWLWADLASPAANAPLPEGFHVERVRDERGMAAWVRLSEEGFGGELGCFYDAYARHGYGPGAFSLHYIAYLGNRAVASATLLDAGGTASIYDLSTPPALRRQGLGGALMRFLLGEIRARGYRDTWIWSSNMARGLYQELGYVDVDFGLREHSWKK